MSVFQKIALLVAGFLLLAGCGPDDWQSHSQIGQRIVNGAESTDERHRAVVAVTVEEGYGYCTGTLIAPDVVLTAAHCIQGFSKNGVVFGDDLTGGEMTAMAVIERWVHPGYGTAKFWNDVGLLRLATDAPPDVVPIPPLPHQLGLGDDDIGQDLQFVGFGWTDPDLQDYGIKMQVYDDISLICEDPSGCSSPVLNDTIPEHTFCHDQDPGGICIGDSGGPALIEREGVLYVAGVTTFTSARCDVIACSASVDNYEDELRDFTHPPEDDPCEEDGMTCDDSNPCTQDGCLPMTGCTHHPVADGSACPHPDACDGQGSCQSGVCQPGEATDCGDNDDVDDVDDVCEGAGCLPPEDTDEPAGIIVGSCSTAPQGMPTLPLLLLGILLIVRTRARPR